MMKMQEPNFAYRLFPDIMSQDTGETPRTFHFDAGNCREKKVEELILSKLNTWQLDAEVQYAMHAYEHVQK
jgi:hypothetical protein